ncbi:hypothetical protein [Janthinobacterium lividum]|uniref:hypothetical protein n=1 Tax=Janthinobacterium lividum TaxID=29581 RepID=UPI001B8255A7|nr:hypothetical protein [Janthinobacterium lividum]MBR7632643.1 hypothetical protein [Janthinobacterium lividum]
MSYEFLEDYLPDDMRVNYKIIKWWFFKYAYRYCRNRIERMDLAGDFWADNESEYAYAYEQFNYGIEQPLEYLMIQVVSLIVDSGRGSKQFCDFHRGEIDEILRLNKLEDLFLMIDDEVELKDFKCDLKVLKIF